MHKLSVLLPVRNGQSYICNSLQQIQANVREDDEVLVVDDSSSDDTPKLLETFTSIFPQLRIIRNARPGLVNALNLGIKQASNNWIARFDVDDDYPSMRLENQRLLISKSTVAIFSDYSIWSESKGYLGYIPSPVLPLATGISLIHSQRTAHPSVIFNKEAVIEVGGYRGDDFPAEDLSLWLRLLRVGNLVSSPTELLKYRLSTNSVSGSNYHLAKEKARALTLSLRFPDRFLSEAIMKCELNLNEYDQVSNTYQRKILHLRELKSAISTFGCTESEKKIFRSCLLDALSSIPPYLKTLEMAYWKFRRSILRASS